MAPTRLTPARVLAGFAGVSVVVILAVAVIWLHLDPKSVGRSDFTNAYTGGTLLREGHRTDLYDARLQASLSASLILPDREGPVQFVAPPPAAAVVAPFTLLPLRTAYRVWSLVQLTFVIAAIALAVRAAPWPPGMRARRSFQWPAAVAALGSLGPVSLVLLGQWDGLAAFGLSIAYWCRQRDRHATAGFALALAFGLAKPHLAIGIAVYIVALRDRRLIAGAVGGATALAVCAVVLVSPSGIAAWIAIDRADFSNYLLRTQLSFTGFFASWLGGTGVAVVLGAAAGVCAIAGCAVLGDRARRHCGMFTWTLVGALTLSLAAAPHLLEHDLTLLSPAFIWALATASSRGEPATLRVLGLWGIVWFAALLDFGSLGAAPPGRVVPLALAACGVAALAATRNPHSTADAQTVRTALS